MLFGIYARFNEIIYSNENLDLERIPLSDNEKQLSKKVFSPNWLFKPQDIFQDHAWVKEPESNLKNSLSKIV